MEPSRGALVRRQLPKLMACMTKNSLENLRNRALFSMDVLDAKGIRRRRQPLYQCLILELYESGFNESSDYLQDLIYDNIQLVNEDDIGIVVDLRKRNDYLEHIVAGLQKAERFRDKGNTKQEALELLRLAQYYTEQGKGILWLAEKFYLASIAVSSQFLLDGGRQKGVCKYFYAKFLLEKFPGADPEEAFNISIQVRDLAIGKTWPLYEPDPDEKGDSQPKRTETLFAAIATLLHGILLNKARRVRKEDAGKAERLARLAERRAKDAGHQAKIAEAIIEIGICQLMMNNLNNAQKTFERAFKIFTKSQNIDGLCEVRLHLAAVMQRLGDHESAAKLLTEMGSLAMTHGLSRHLGRALHLLGELHLRRERPELGTRHLAEAFECFMGYGFEKTSKTLFKVVDSDVNEEDALQNLKANIDKVFEEEAEQSRLMMAVSAGQELMASYFNLIREAYECTVAQSKIVEWKLSKAKWWMKKKHHELVPCMCKQHNRTPLDVMRKQLEFKLASMEAMQKEQAVAAEDAKAKEENVSKIAFNAPSKHGVKLSTINM